MDMKMDFDSISLGLEFNLLAASMQDKALAERATATAKLLGTVVDDFTANAARLERTYLPEVFPAELARARQTAHERIKDATGQLLADLADTEMELRQRLSAPAPDNSLAATLLQIERRQLLRQADPLKRLEWLWNAAETGDTVTVDSIRLAPAYDRLVPEHELSKTLDALAKTSFPDAAKRLTEIVKIKSALQSATDSAVRRIGAAPTENIVVQ